MLLCIAVSLLDTTYADESFLFSIHYDTSVSPNKIALIIPGMNQGEASAGYGAIGDCYKRKGIRPIYVNIRWRAMGIVGVNKLSTVAKQLCSMMSDTFPQSRIFLFGFSFGSVIALKIAQHLACQHMLLCSMSPVFLEDWKCMAFPQKQFFSLFTDFSTNGLSYSTGIDSCIFFLYGDHEKIISKEIIKRRQTAFRRGETIMVKDARHDISGQSYQNAIRTILKRIPDDATTP